MSVIYRIRYDYGMSTLSYVHEIAAHTTEKFSDGTVKQLYMRFLDSQAKLRINVLRKCYADYAVEMYTAIFNNNCDQNVRIHLFDVGFSIPDNNLTLEYFSSDWGSEFFPHRVKIENEFAFGSVSGRSCKGFIPWSGLVTSTGCLTATLAWSGNWNCTITPKDNSYFFSMGLSGKDSYFDIAPGGSFASATMYVAKGASIEHASFALRRFFRKHLSLHKDKDSEQIPLEYNGWWPYEDRYISEDVYLKNSEIAKNIGIRYAVLDAGWFGTEEDGQNWYEKRGDWELINRASFPSGIKNLFVRAESVGVLPGIWCEIEAVGKHAKLNDSHKDLIALRDDVSLGYICMGFEKSREWALSVIDRLLGEYNAKWIKFDFNLDPGWGCNAVHHDHGKGYGLFSIR